MRPDGDDPLALLSEPSDEQLLAAFRAGNLDAATQLYERYARRLRALAKARTPAALAGRLDPTDIVQSVFRSFFHGAKSGCYDVPTGTELWPLLLVIALNKIRGQGAFHTAARRDVRRTRALSESEPVSRAIRVLEGGDEQPFLQVVAEDLVDAMPEPLREVVRLRLEGYAVDEIAAQIGRTKRSVERLLQECRQRLGLLLQEGETENG